MLAAGLSVTLRYTVAGNFSEANSLQYTPTDTRLLSFSSLLCQSLGISVNTTLLDPSEIEKHWLSVSLYMLSSPPSLTGRESFSVGHGFNLDRVNTYYKDTYYNYTYYYLYPGSQVTVSTCIEGQNYSAVFLLIEGSRNFSRWKEDPYSSNSEHSFKITTSCTSTNIPSKSYAIKSEGYYYLVFCNNMNNVSIFLSVNLFMERTYYQLTNNGSKNSVIHSCSVKTEFAEIHQCSVTVPVTGATGFMEIEPHRTPEDSVRYWDSEIYVTTTCKARYWMYAVLSAGTVAIMVCSAIILMTCLYLCSNRHKTRKQLVVSPSNDPRAPLIPTSPDFTSYESSGGNISPVYRPFPVY